MAADRTAPGPGGEARSLHRHGAGQRSAAPRGPAGCLPPDLSRHLRDRPPQPGAPDPLRNPERAARCGRRARYAPWTDMEASMRGVGAPAVQRRHPPRGRRLRRAGVQPLGRARLHEPAQPRRPRGRAGSQRAPGADRPDRDRGRALHVQPRAARRVRRRVRDRRRRGGGRRDRRRRAARGSAAGARPAKPCCATSQRFPASTCRRCTTSSTTARSSRR